MDGIPRVIANILDAESLGRVRVQDIVDQISGMLREERRFFVFSLYDLLVELLRILVFKRQIAADHGKEDDARAPDVGTQPVVTLTSNHLGSGVAGRSAGCLELLSLFV